MPPPNDGFWRRLLEIRYGLVGVGSKLDWLLASVGLSENPNSVAIQLINSWKLLKTKDCFEFSDRDLDTVAGISKIAVGFSGANNLLSAG